MNTFEKSTETPQQLFEKGMQNLSEQLKLVQGAATARFTESKNGIDNLRDDDIEEARENAFNQLDALLKLAELLGEVDARAVLLKQEEGRASGAQGEMSLND